MPADNSRPFSKVVGYIRVSTKMQGASGLGLEAQRKAIEDFARQKGVPVLLVFEEVESGKRSDRPKLAEAIRRCGLTGAALVAAKVDRFGRKASDLFKLRDARFPVVALDAPDADGFLFGILALVAENEGKTISARTKVALAAAKVRREKAGKPPLGGDRGNLARSAAKANARSAEVRGMKAGDHARILRPEIEELRAAGATSLRALAEGLNARGITAPRGGEWSAVQVQRVRARMKRRSLDGMTDDAR